MDTLQNRTTSTEARIFLLERVQRIFKGNRGEKPSLLAKGVAGRTANCQKPRTTHARQPCGGALSTRDQWRV